MSDVRVVTQRHVASVSVPTTMSYDGPQIYDIQEQGAVEDAVHKNFATPLFKTESEICELLTWPKGWNGYDAAKPKIDSIRNSCTWIEQLYRDLSKKLWIKPHVIADADGDVVFEWWNNSKKLTVYVSPTSVEYITVAGPDIAEDMDDGVIESPADSRALWYWLTS